MKTIPKKVRIQGAPDRNFDKTQSVLFKLDWIKPVSRALIFVFRLFQGDKVVAYAVLGNIVSAITGPITAILIVKYFSPEIQGYYYTFGSLISIQFLIEFGLGQTLIQFASHEWAKLQIDKNGRIVGEVDSLSRLNSLGQFAFKWYSVSALVFLLIICPSGYIFFSFSPPSNVDWVYPWIFLCAGVCLNMVIMPIFYFLQGCNQTASYWWYRLVLQIINGICLWIAIINGAKLWTLALATAVGVGWSLGYLVKYYTRFIGSIFSKSLGARIRWRSEFWPVQWRVAICWASAYFTTLIFTPIIFKIDGPVVAGQMGLTVSLSLILLAISSNWVVTKAPRFGILVAQGKVKEMDRLFFKSFIASIILICCGAIVVWGAAYLLTEAHHPIGDRILSPLPLSFILLGTIFNMITLCISVYLRAYKIEPMAAIYLGGFILILGFAIYYSKTLGVIGVTASYLGVLVLFQTPMSYFIFNRFRNKWLGSNPANQSV